MYNTTVSHIIGGVGQPAIPHTTHTRIKSERMTHPTQCSSLISIHYIPTSANQIHLSMPIHDHAQCARTHCKSQREREKMKTNHNHSLCILTKEMHVRFLTKKPCTQRCTCEIKRAVEGWNLNATQGIKFYVDWVGMVIQSNKEHL
jgi:redox-regulated HSP33 family molecular chaperone